MNALNNLARAPGTNIGINGLTRTVQTLNPMVRYLGPYQTVCDYWNYFWTYLSDTFSEQTSFGFSQRALINTANSGAAQQPRAAGRDGAGQRRRQRLADSAAATSSSTASPTAPRSRRRARRTVRPVSAGSPRSSTPTTRRAATSAPTSTPRGTRARPSPGAPACPPGETFSRAPHHRPAGPERPGEQLMRRTQERTAQADEQVRRRRDRNRADRDLLLRGLHQVRQPVRQPVHGQGGVRERQRAPERLAGPHRRRQRGHGDRRQHRARLPLGGQEPRRPATRPR